jgi:hypothetical protein
MNLNEGKNEDRFNIMIFVAGFAILINILFF